MRSQTLQFTTAGGLLMVGLMLGFQIGKSRAADQATFAVAGDNQTVAAAASAPVDYFPAQYDNKARFVEPLPPQF